MRYVFFSLTREEGGNADMTAVEALKDGRFNNTKYEVIRCVMSIECPHPYVVILGNSLPTNTIGLTLERWTIGSVLNKESDIKWFKFDVSGGAEF